MDDIDHAIIEALSEEGRLTNKAVAQRIGLSEALVANRLRALIAAKAVRIVARRRASADPDTVLTAILQLHLSAPDQAEAVTEVLEALDAVFIVYETSRRPEICAYARVRSAAELDQLGLQLAERAPGIAQLNVLPFLKIHRLRRAIVSLEHPPAPRPRAGDLQDALVAELELDGRQPISVLARKLGLSQTATRYRLEKLLREGTVEIKLLADARALGYAVWADIRVSLVPGQIHSAIALLSRHPDVISVAHISGPANLLVFVVARSVVDLDAFVREQIRTLAGLHDFAIMRVPRVLKYDFNYFLG
jgi:DNA-binding Lrp family transcriptional regulator